MAGLDVGEVFRIARGIDHGLVDLEELPILAGLRGADQRAGAEPDHGNAQRRALALADRRNRLTDAAVLVIVGDRLGLAGDRRAVIVPEFLGAVDRGAVHQHVILAVRRHHDLVDAEEAAHGLHPPVVRGIHPDQHQRQRHHGGQLPAIRLEQDRQYHRDDRNRAYHVDSIGLQPCEDFAAAVGRRDQRHCNDGQQWPEPAGPFRPPFLCRRPAQHRQRHQNRILRTQENVNGAINPANSPPTMPPNDSAT